MHQSKLENYFPSARKLLLILIFACCFLFSMMPGDFDYATLTVSGLNKSWTTGIFGLSTTDSWTDSSYLREAGWPIRYYRAILLRDQSMDCHWNWFGLLVDLVLWCAIGNIWINFCSYSRRNLFSKKIRLQKLQISTRKLLLVTFVIAVFLSCWSHQRNRALYNRELERRILATGGRCERCALISRMFSPLSRFAIFTLDEQITGITLFQPTTEILAKALEPPSLRKLSLSGGNYDRQLLKKLPLKFELRELEISDRSLQLGDLETIANCPSLGKLSLAWHENEVDTLSWLKPLKHMESLSLLCISSSLNFSALSDLKQSLTELVLQPNSDGSISSIDLFDLSNLKRLFVFGSSRSEEHSRFSIRLRNLPQLHRLGLDGKQRYELELEDLPVLSDMEPAGRIDDIALGNATYDRLKIKSIHCQHVPHLDSLSLDPATLTNIQIKDALHLNLGLSGKDSQASKIEASQTWIDELKVCDGIVELILDHLDLSKIDLTPLSKLSNLRRLSLRNTGLTLEHTRQIGSLPALRHLDLSSNQVCNQQIAGLLQQCSQIEELVLDSWRLDRLELSALPSLRMLFADINVRQNRLPNLLCRNVSLRDLPRLAESIHTGLALESLYLNELPELIGIQTCTPWPMQASLSGLRDLEYFCGGGRNLDDTHALPLLECPNLQSLTLAHSNVSKNVLARLPELTNLKTLNLASQYLDDSVIENWSTWPSLRKLVLRGASISDRALIQIASFRNLVSLEFEIPDGMAQSIRPLQQLPTLHQLKIHNAHIDFDFMVAISKITKLSSLTLSNCVIGDDAVQTLLESRKSINSVHLENVQIGVEALTRLTKNNLSWTQGWQAGKISTALRIWRDEPFQSNLIFASSAQPDSDSVPEYWLNVDFDLFRD